MHSNFGNPYRPFIGNVQLFIVICGKPIQGFCQANDIEQSVKRDGATSPRGETNHLERFNNTLRQRVSRLGRKTLSFSKKHSHHLAAIWYFIHHYNSNLSS